MSANFQGDEARDEFEEVFGFHISKLTLRQLWWIVKFCKTVRMRGRSNTAFNNVFKRTFSGAFFRQVTKKREDGSEYPGLDIKIKE